MHHLVPESSGPAGPINLLKESEISSRRQHGKLSFNDLAGDLSLNSIGGPTYLTAQTLVQQVSYALSDKIFTYSPDSFDLDVAVKAWSAQQSPNAYGYATGVSPMQIRTGAGSIALGYVFSKDFDLKKRHIPQSLIGPTSSLPFLGAALDQLCLLYSVASPFVAHIAAVDYAAGTSQGLVTDYTSALFLAESLGLGVVCSISAHESQHMALFSTLLSKIMPTVHIYDGVTVGREKTRVIDVLDQRGLYNTYEAVIKELSGTGEKLGQVEGRVQHLLRAFNGELGTAYGLFEYQGHAAPETVLVVFGSVEGSLSFHAVDSLVKDGKRLGVLRVRVYRPFVEAEFLAALPTSVRTITVLGQVHNQQAVADPTVHSSLYDDVLTAVTFSSKWRNAVSVSDMKYAREHVWTPSSVTAVLYSLEDKERRSSLIQVPEVLKAQQSGKILLREPPETQQYIFWDVDDSELHSVPASIASLLSQDSSSNVTTRTVQDNLLQGGVTRTDIRSSKKTTDVSYPVEEADAVYVGDEVLFKHIDIVGSIKHGGVVLVRLPGCKNEELEKRLPDHVRRAISVRHIKLHILDPQAFSSDDAGTINEADLTQLAFLQMERPALFKKSLTRIAEIGSGAKMVETLEDIVTKAVRSVETPESWGSTELNDEKRRLPTTINPTSFVKFQKEEDKSPALLRTWQAAAKGLVFKEAYGTKSALRPDLSVKTWTVHVKENRRLTPLSYDRNIFHIEFDLGNSGLRYEIGEALGIHGENDETEVQNFIKFYGLEPEQVVEVPSREDPDVLETRTVYQGLMQNLDIFGRPPKKFYEALAEFAEDQNEKKELLTLASPDGGTEFKRRAEVDTITYADILLEFPSAHPSFHDIATIVNPMKRREYSIASSQKVTPNSVSLLIVTVAWVDSKGRDRFGQATRYLNRLKIGDPVTVSVKPSVMKLPTESTQPLIMAGLGTGLAPFRAFVQYRAWQKAQGIPIGAVLLYMGSRHQREEYLYGEEWEAYQDAGVITLLGRAFSRDQPQKIYIQDRMRQTIHDIIQAYIKQTGSFYLCGPTWPVPDVTEVLQEAIALDAKSQGKKVDSRREIERLKDDLRYVLEVY